MSEEKQNPQADAEAAAAAANQADTDAAAAEGAAQSAKKDNKQVRARVLTDCEYGRGNDLVTLPEAAAKAAEKAGLVDTNKAAVAYAEALAKAQQ